MKTAVLLILLLMLVLPLTGSAQDANDIPYLYYYDSSRRAFIIERADGADKRILANEVLDDETDYLIGGPGWSPDGKWLAFTAVVQPRPGPLVLTDAKAYVISVDGETMLESLQEMREPFMQWSPNGEQLFVVSQQDANGIVTVSFDIIKANLDERQTVHEFQYASQNPDQAMYDVRWINDDVIVEGYETIEETRQPAIYVFEDGKYQTRVRANNLIPGKNFRTFASSTGWVAQRTSSGLELVNLLTTERAAYQIAWDDDYTGEYRMIWNGNEGILSAENIWYVTVDNILGIVHFDEIVRPFARYFDWSPDGQHLFMILGHLSFQFSDGDVSLLDFTVQHILADFSLTWIDENSAFLLVDETLFRHDFDTQETQQIADSVLYATESSFSASPSGETIGYIREGAIFYNPGDNHVDQFSPHPYSYFTLTGGHMEWRGEWVLIYENAFQAGSGRPYFLRVIREDGTEARELARITRGDPVYAGWVPANVDVGRMPHSPIEYTAQLQPEQVLRGDHWSFRIEWSPDGAKIAAGLEWDMGDITIWDVERGTPLETISEVSLDTDLRWEDGELVLRNLPRQNIDFDGNGEWRVISRDAEGSYVQLYSIESGQFVCPVMGGDYDVTSSASLSPDGKYLATGHRYVPARIWDMETCTVIATLPTAAPGVAFSPDGTQLAAGVSWDIHIYDIELLLGKPRIFG